MLTTEEILKKVRALEIKSKRLTNHMFTGEYHSAFKGMGMSYKEVREEMVLSCLEMLYIQKNIFSLLIDISDIEMIKSINLLFVFLTSQTQYQLFKLRLN